MGVNKVDLSTGETLIDISKDTVTPQTLAKGYTAHNSNGEQIVGTLVPEGGGGSGIIDVTELPTSNIDENAVYRVTETIQVEKTEVYIKAGSTVVTIQQYFASLGVSTVPNIYVVDELPPNMLPSDAQTFSALHFYILKTDGIVYAYVPAYGGVITIGLFGFQAMGYDKGFTENINAENESGVYTTIEAYKQVVRWFIRKNGEWKEVTAYTTDTSPHGFTDIYMLSGHLTTIATFISGDFEEIDEGWFITPNGTVYDLIKSRMFTSNKLKTAVIPHFIFGVQIEGFASCYGLTTITFRGVPDYISGGAFYDCKNLTTINVPWSEGEISQAPWGAKNATINYNYTGA